MKKVVLCANPIKDKDFQLTMQTKKLLERLGVQVVISVPPLDVEYTELPEDMPVVPMKKALAGANLMVCLGGDGTILHAAKDAAMKKVPIVGINLGHRGFMAEIEPDELCLLEKVIKGDFELDKRMMFDVSVLRGGVEIMSEQVLNDAVVAKGAVARVIGLSVYSDSSLISEFSADGVVVCTPTGSTAYSMSAGGPIIEPSADAIVVTPICAHSLHAKPIVLSRDRTVTVLVGELRGKSAYLSTDGNEAVSLNEGDKVVVSRSGHSVSLVRVSGKDFYMNINEKLSSPRGDRQ